MKSSLAALLLASSPPGAAGYFAQANNAHVEFVSSAAEVVAGANAAPLLGGHQAELLQAVEGMLATKEELKAFTIPQLLSLFEGWMAEFGREYEDVEEKGRKMLVWLENHATIEAHNAKGLSFALGHNDYSDLTHDEFKKRMKLGEHGPGLRMPEDGKPKEFQFLEFHEEEAESSNNLRGAAEAEAEVTATERRLEAASDDGDGIDWHAKGLMGPIRNQGLCGACWAFSAVGSIESAMAIVKYDKLPPTERAELAEKAQKQVRVGEAGGTDLGLVVPLSEQNLIDCDTAYEKGCEGGLMTTTFEEEEHHKGICSEADYPYLMTLGTCAADLCTPVPNSIVRDHVDVVPRKNAALARALEVKPVTAAMVAVDPMLQFYKSGIYQTEGCGKVTKQMGQEGCNLLYEGQDVCLPDINHGVLVVGYGTDAAAATDVKTFFKVKNSWGDAWGEGGYIRLARYEVDKTDPMDNWGECGILTLLSYPVMDE